RISFLGSSMPQIRKGNLPDCRARRQFMVFRDNWLAMRIGVIADTHCPEFLDELPTGVFEKLRGVDLILHAGDVGDHQTLERLRELAPVEAVRGDHDAKLRGLPLRRLVEVGGRRIAVIHGNRSRLLEEPITLVATLTLGMGW